MKNSLVSLVNKVKTSKVADAVKTAVLATSLAIMTLPVSADLQKGNIDSIKTTVEKAINLVMGFVVAGGVINIVLGIRNLAAGVSDEGGGQDQQKISKGKGQLFSGIIMVGGISVLALLGINGDLLAGYFS